MWRVNQTRRFARTYKKLHAQQAADVDNAIAVVATNPYCGEQKKGDLAELWVYKFHSHGQLFLLGYTQTPELCLICLEAVGPHENFYRDLKRS